MKRIVVQFFCSVAMLLSTLDLGFAQSVSGNNGVLGFNLSLYGRLRAGVVPYPTAGTRELERMSFIAALDENNVFDYQEDSDSADVLPRPITLPGVDLAAECTINNDFSGAPPDLKVHHQVLLWINTSYVVKVYNVINIGSSTVNVLLGTAVIPQPSGTFGGETIDYDAAHKTAYYFRTGEAPYWGVRLLSGVPSSFAARDWDEYSPDPSDDAAVDSTRYAMTAGTNFDTTLVAGVNGSIFNLNAGLASIAPGDTVQFVYAVAYGNSLASMLAASDSAQARYDVLTSVENDNQPTPETYALHQNYPNPFNPSTTIEFSLAKRGPVSLEVFDVLGRSVKSLVAGTLAAGVHKVTFDASRLASGVYFYKLHAGDFTRTRKLILLR